ncbi:MAG TPA: chemotaxis protein CheA [Acidobacteriaceae bacterium]|jgi:two-component system chemotaxis sensor kinase CheA|nr:chemotaxis protein CheA [Acidobacteriaceae bacterium]
MKIDLTQFRQTFLQESADHIATMESGLLALRSSPGDAELLNAVFRSAHSIKGGAGSFGLESLAQFTHGLESLLERLRTREMEVTDEILGLLLASIDVLRTLLDPDAPDTLPNEARDLSHRIETLALGAPSAEPASGTAVPDPEVSSPSARADPGTLTVYRIDFRPDRELFRSGTNPIVLLRNLAALGDVTVIHLDAGGLPALADLDPAQCYLAWTIEIAATCPEEELRAVFEFVEHLAEITIRRADAADPAKPAAVQPAPSIAEPGPLAAASIAAEGPAHPTALKARAASSTGKSARSAAKRTSKPGSGGESASIRVATEKVDRLIDLVGELVIAHVMTAQMVETFTPGCLPKLREAVAAMERNTRELHERVMAVRMLPVNTLFQRYTRTVYDIAQASGKQIELVLTGEETEVDKSMLELLGDPLTHLIRNAGDHGIETTAERHAAGKPEQGTISLRAFHRSGRIVIEVQDDGAGIDPARVRAKAIERGLIASDAVLTDDQLRLLIFEPGFSTRTKVSEFSGRGVGMDVVRQNVRQLNGSVQIASETGRGSTVSIELPLTLAILEGLLIRVSDRTLVLPLLSVVETVCPRPGQIQRIAEQGEIILIRDQPIPLLRLRRYLGMESATAEPGADGMGTRSLIVVVEAGRKKIGLAVDELLGQQQVVVKSLERHLRKIEGLMGATILGDGCVAPIIDVACLAGLDLYALSAGAASLTRFSNSDFQSAEKGDSAHAMV